MFAGVYTRKSETLPPMLTTWAQGRALAQADRPRTVYVKRKREIGRPALPKDAVERFTTGPYLTLAALSGYTSLSPSTLRKMMRDPRDPLPSFTVGRSRRFAKQSVDRWMARREAQADAVDRELETLRARRATQ